MIREAAVAGSFYPADPGELKEYLESVMKKGFVEYHNPKVIIAPHAGYVYSGAVAASVYSKIPSFDRYIVLGPNHTGMGASISVFNGVYRMPFGEVLGDEELARVIVEHSNAELDYYAHLWEHSIEVQLPFVDYISDGDYRVVSVVVGTMDSEELRLLGEALAKASKAYDGSVLIVVSSDFNHYEDHKTTILKDELAVERILSLDEDGLMDVVRNNDITMCGAGCAYASIVASKLLGAKKGELVEHTTSGEVNKDYSRVVGYASIVIE